jgi:hypothetical protein
MSSAGTESVIPLEVRAPSAGISAFGGARLSPDHLKATQSGYLKLKD